MSVYYSGGWGLELMTPAVFIIVTRTVSVFKVGEGGAGEPSVVEVSLAVKASPCAVRQPTCSPVAHSL